MKNFLINYIFIYFIYLSFIGCSSDDNSTNQSINYSKKIIGKWQRTVIGCDKKGEGGNIVINRIINEFTEDGKLKTIEDKYIIDKNKLFRTWGGVTEKLEKNIKIIYIKEDEMLLQYFIDDDMLGNGIYQKYKRVK